MVLLRAETLAVRLRDLGILTPQQLEQAKQELANTQERFSAILVRQGLLRDEEMGRRLAMQLGSIPQQLDHPPEESPSAGRIPIAMWRSHRLAPVQERAGNLLLATDDPLSVFALDFFARRCGCPVQAVLVSEQDFASLLEAVATPRAASNPPAPPAASESAAASPPVRPAPALPARPQRAETVAPLTLAPVAPPAKGPPSIVGQAHPIPAGVPGRAMPVPSSAARPASPQGQARHETDDEPIIRLVDSMLSEAVRLRASDIHIEPGRQGLRVRYRIDGVLNDVNTPPKALQGPIASRIKIMSGLNIAEKRLPQDGRFQVSVENRPLDVRISTLPAAHGESIVMRLLDRSQPIRGLSEMGITPEVQRHWEELIHRPHGMVLVTGPTGSGKTTTLYGALAMLNQADRKLITVEDPVEYQLSGVNQVVVKASIGLTFAAGLRAMLRQAPDVIMVGEIRDQETAQIAVQAALTGHLVLSTLHTNDAPSAITRLVDMGIPSFLIASTVQGVLAQRLVRRICPECRMTDNATPEEQAFLGSPEVVQVIRSNGCEKCRNSGYYGRLGIFELLTISEPLRQLIVGKPTASAIRAMAVQEGMRTLREDGCAKIREGSTTIAEVLRVVTDAG